MSRSSLKLLLALVVVMAGMLAVDASRAHAQYGFWQRGPVRRVIAFAVSPWVMTWRSYRAAYGVPVFYRPGYGGFLVAYDGSPCGSSSGDAALLGSRPLEHDAGALVLSVPESAKVYINGQETAATGGTRKYFSRGLLADKRYKYEIRVTDQRDGEAVEQQRTVYLAGGNRSELSFALPAQPQSFTVSSRATKADTLLKLRVPADAQVTLAGTPTTLMGAERSYLSTELPAGKLWEGYTIRATIVRDGRELVAEKTITLTGGETREVLLQFAPAAEIAPAAEPAPASEVAPAVAQR